jgi:hypothetical protein
MKSITFARWELECEPDITRQLFGRIPQGAPESCGCAPCRNFAEARTRIYPADVTRLFDVLGIASNREAEVYHTHRVEPGKHHYGGWFHFVGRIASGSDAAKPIGTNLWTPDLEKADAEFQLGFTKRLALVPDAFKGHTVVQLEFQTTVPWLLDEAEPTR